MDLVYDNFGLLPECLFYADEKRIGRYIYSYAKKCKENPYDKFIECTKDKIDVRCLNYLVRLSRVEYTNKETVILTLNVYNLEYSNAFKRRITKNFTTDSIELNYKDIIFKYKGDTYAYMMWDKGKDLLEFSIFKDLTISKVSALEWSGIICGYRFDVYEGAKSRNFEIDIDAKVLSSTTLQTSATIPLMKHGDMLLSEKEISSGKEVWNITEYPKAVGYFKRVCKDFSLAVNA